MDGCPRHCCSIIPRTCHFPVVKVRELEIHCIAVYRKESAQRWRVSFVIDDADDKSCWNILAKAMRAIVGRVMSATPLIWIGRVLSGVFRRFCLRLPEGKGQEEVESEIRDVISKNSELKSRLPGLMLSCSSQCKTKACEVR